MVSTPRNKIWRYFTFTNFQNCGAGQADVCLFARFGINVAAAMKIFIFWNVTPCSQEEIYRSFGKSVPEFAAL